MTGVGTFARLVVGEAGKKVAAHQEGCPDAAVRGIESPNHKGGVGVLSDAAPARGMQDSQRKRGGEAHCRLGLVRRIRSNGNRTRRWGLSWRNHADRLAGPCHRRSALPAAPGGVFRHHWHGEFLLVAHQA